MFFVLTAPRYQWTDFAFVAITMQIWGCGQYRAVASDFLPQPASHRSRHEHPTGGDRGAVKPRFAWGSEAVNRRMSKCSPVRSEEHTSELQSHLNLVCRLLLEKKKILKI